MKYEGFLSKLKKLLKDRHFYLVLLVLVVLTAVVVRLYILQIVEGETHEDEATVNSLVAVKIEAPRGNIYDRNGVLLATTYTEYDVKMTYVATPQAERDRMYLELINLLEENGESHIKSISMYLSSPDTWSRSLEEDESKRSRWINEFAIKKSDRDDIKTARDAFDYLKDRVLEIGKEYTDEEAFKIMEIRYETYRYGLSSLSPMTIAEGISEETMSQIEARHIEFAGITTTPVYKRQYVNAEHVGNIIGYVRAISNEEYEEMKSEGYSFDDIVGKTGIEKAEEKTLAGTKGVSYVYYDRATSTVKEYSRTDPVPGNDIHLTIDVNLQKIAYEALEESIKKIASEKDGISNFGDANAGTVIVENVKTGEILSMVSYPTYDINLFISSPDDPDAQKAILDLFASKDAPTVNRATQGLYAIGSTFKPVVASAALEKGVINIDTKYMCEGSVIIANRLHNCLRAHGEINVVTAIRQSCNVFFQRAAIETGINTLDTWAEAYGLGSATGIEIAEAIGNRSNPETMRLKEEDASHIWTDSDTAQSAIGQLYTLFTPIQLVNYTSALANGGYLNTPYLVDTVVSQDGRIVLDKQPERTKISLRPATLDIIRQGMCEMINNNDVAQVEMKAFPKNYVAGKTGTPETGYEAYGQSSNSVFICYAPADDPEIAISVVIERGAWGTNAIATAARILEAYFSEDISGNSEQARDEGLIIGPEFRDLRRLWDIFEKEEAEKQAQKLAEQQAAEKARMEAEAAAAAVAAAQAAEQAAQAAANAANSENAAN